MIKIGFHLAKHCTDKVSITITSKMEHVMPLPRHACETGVMSLHHGDQ